MKILNQIVFSTLLTFTTATNFGMLGQNPQNSDDSTSVSASTTEKSSTSNTPTTTEHASSVEMSITPETTSDSTMTEKTITYADSPLTTIVTTDEIGRTTTKPVWWLPSTTATSSEGVSTSESDSGTNKMVTTVQKTIESTVSGKLTTITTQQVTTTSASHQSVSTSMNSTVSIHSNAGNNLVVNLGLAGSLAMAIAQIL